MNNFLQDADFEILQKENIFYDLLSLNKVLNNDDSLILYVNIRRLNSNYDKLHVLIQRLKNKPMIIVCSETWNL